MRDVFKFFLHGSMGMWTSLLIGVRILQGANIKVINMNVCPQVLGKSEVEIIGFIRAILNA